MSLRYLKMDGCDSSKTDMVLVNCRNKGSEQKRFSTQIFPMNAIFKLFPKFKICISTKLVTLLVFWCHPIKMDVSIGVLHNVCHVDECIKAFNEEMLKV